MPYADTTTELPTITPIDRERAIVQSLFKTIEAAALRSDTEQDINTTATAIRNYGEFLNTISLRTMVGIENPVE